jgi:tetratricopeptide (TPR) repeat protein
LQCVIDALIERGDFQIALQAIRSLPDPYLRILSLAQIAQSGKLLGHELKALAEEAEQNAKQVRNPYQRKFALETVCRIWMDLGEIERAWELAQKIEKSQRLHALMGEFAVLFAKQGDVQRALSIASQLPDKWAQENEEAGGLPFPPQFGIGSSSDKLLTTRQEVLKVVAEELAKQGKFDEAMEIAKSLENEAVRTEVLEKLVDARERIGMSPAVTKAAEKTLQFAKDLERRLGAYGLLKPLTQPLEQAVNLSKELNAARKLPDDWLKVTRLSQIAMRLAYQNRKKEAKAVLSEATACINKIKSPQAKLSALREVAKCWRFLGEYEMAEKLEREHWKLWRRWLDVMGTKLRMETKPKR